MLPDQGIKDYEDVDSNERYYQKQLQDESLRNLSRFGGQHTAHEGPDSGDEVNQLGFHANILWLAITTLVICLVVASVRIRYLSL